MSKDLVEAIARATWEARCKFYGDPVSPMPDDERSEYRRDQAAAALSAIEREGWTLTPPQRIEGATFVCELPRELGEITGMRVEGDRLVCDTKSGIPFVLSASPKQGDAPDEAAAALARWQAAQTPERIAERKAILKEAAKE